MDPVDLILLYEHRFGIENMIKELKELFNLKDFHCWTKALEKLTPFNSKERHKQVPEEDRDKVIAALERNEMMMLCNIIAHALLSLLTIEMDPIPPEQIFYQRTYRHPQELTLSQVKKLLEGILSKVLELGTKSKIGKILNYFPKRPIETSYLAQQFL